MDQSECVERETFASKDVQLEKIELYTRMCGIKIVIEDAFVKFTVSGRFDSENA